MDLRKRSQRRSRHSRRDSRAASDPQTSGDGSWVACRTTLWQNPELGAARAARARDIGIDDVVCSAEEAANLRGLVGQSIVLVTLGIRPAGSATGDQKRITTPARAIEAGADYLVVGRPVTEAGDSRNAADAIVAEIEQATPK